VRSLTGFNKEENMRKSLVSTLAGVLLGAPAAANDSTAEMAAGGLVLRKTDAIEMASEDLFISADAVRVHYVFRNRTAKDVRTVVAFPMPDIDLSEREGGDVAYPSGFVTTVEGKRVLMALEQKAVLKGKDYTALLTALKVPIAEPEVRLDALGPAEQDKLLALGLVTAEEGGRQGAGNRQLNAVWTVRQAYHWTQLFPAGRDLVVEHRYVPGTGGSVETPLADPAFRRTAEGRAYGATYCADAAFLAGVDRLAQSARGAERALPELRVSYVLKTGANWRAPIGDFRLVVDKGTPANLISFCADGVRKISATQFEVRHRNWLPDRDLDILIVQPQSGD